MSESTPYAEILLSTYNGTIYLEELLESLFAQSYKNWCLVIRDDGSTDKTVEMLSHFKKSYPDRIKLINDNQNLGASKSFARLLFLSQAELVFLCDQDDIWHPKKLELMIEKYKQISQNHSNLPILIFSDLEIVDCQKNLICDSFWKKENIFTEYKSDLYMTFFKNLSPGCAMMLNRQLINQSCDVPHEAIMHDWWISLNASLYGKIETIPEKLVKYRIHQQNTIGIREEDSLNLLSRIIRALSNRKILFRMLRSQKKLITQAKAFCNAKNLHFSHLKYWSRVFLWCIHYYKSKKIVP